MKANHKYYLDLAFQIAEKNLGSTKLNPSVGSVVVKNDTIISTGINSINGRPHSEHNALRKIKSNIGASLYTTLEPCAHVGKTPPCVNLIIKKKIKKVYYAFEDPDSRTYQKAKKILNSKGIKTKFIKSKKFKNFYKSYFINKKSNIPFITGKLAISSDFYTINKKKKWITNHKSRKLTHLIRSKYDSIISTSKSVNLDNSLLNCRINGLNNYKPDLFIIDLDLKIKRNLLLNKLIKKRKTYLITLSNNLKKKNFLKKKGFKMITIKSLKNKNDFISLLKNIYKMGYSRLLVESGLTFLNSLIKNKIIHNLYIFKSNKKLGKDGKNNSSLNYIKKLKLKLINVNLNDDKLYKVDF